MTNYHVKSSSGRATRKIRSALMGPTFITAIDYIDSGNFATSIQAGASFDYQLLWVVVWANLMTMLIQFLSAKLRIATGKNLAGQIRDHYPRPVMRFYQVQAEIVAMATDPAESIDAAVGFKFILDVSLLQGAVLTGIATFLILMLRHRRQGPLEKVIGGLLLSAAAAYIVELIFSQPNLAQLGKGTAIPSLPTSETIFLAADVLGAAIMPHMTYLHSSLTQHLHDGSRQQHYSATKWDVAITMMIAGFVNLAIMATTTATFHFSGYTGVTDLDEAYLTLQPLLSHAATTVFGLSLVAAGLSSTVVGTLARQVVMQGFIRFHIPLWVCRTATMLPSFIVILMGLDPTWVLVMSQVLLSFGIVLALVPLLIFTNDSKLMDDLVNSKRVKQTGWMIIVLVVALSIWLLVGTVLGLQLNECHVQHYWRMRRRRLIRPTRQRTGLWA